MGESAFMDIQVDEGVEIPAEVVPLTPELKKIHDEIIANELAMQQQEIAKEQAKKSAEKKLAKIGLTIDEINAVIGGN